MSSQSDVNHEARERAFLEIERLVITGEADRDAEVFVGLVKAILWRAAEAGA